MGGPQTRDRAGESPHCLFGAPFGVCWFGVFTFNLVNVIFPDKFVLFLFFLFSIDGCETSL